jgi:hypothetical protein
MPKLNHLEIKEVPGNRFMMTDFEATCVAQDAIRVDIYDDDVSGSNEGRYTKKYSLHEAMALVIILTQAIQRCEVLMAQDSKGKK